MFTNNPLHHGQSNQSGPASCYSLLFNCTSQSLLKCTDTKALAATNTSGFSNLGVQKTVTVRHHTDGSLWARDNASAATTAFGVVGEQNRDTFFHHLPSTPFKIFFTDLFASHFLDESRVERRYSSSSTSMPSSSQRSNTMSRASGRGVGCISWSLPRIASSSGRSAQAASSFMYGIRATAFSVLAIMTEIP